MATQAQALRAVRARYSKAAGVGFSPRACTREQREAAIARVREIKAREEQLVEVARSVVGCYSRLIAGARFVVDVNGDEPSIERMRTALEQCELSVATEAERKELLLERRELAGKLSSARYMAYNDNGMFRHVHHTADSWAELIEKIEAGKLG